MNNNNHVNQFSNAINELNNKNYKNAEPIFSDLINKFINYDDVEKKLIAFKCALNLSICQINIEYQKPIKINNNVYLEILNNLIKNLKLIESEILKKDKNNSAIINESKSQIFRIIENKLEKIGLDNLATIIRKLSLDLQIEIMISLRKKYFEDSKEIFWRYWYKFLDYLNEKIYRIIKKLFDYGLNLGKILFTSLIILITFSFLYYILPCGNNFFHTDWKIVHQDTKNTPARIEECLYYSLVTFTTVGSEEYWPIGGAAKLLMSLESIAGYFILSLLVAHFARRIK